MVAPWEFSKRRRSYGPFYVCTPQVSQRKSIRSRLIRYSCAQGITKPLRCWIVEIAVSKRSPSELVGDLSKGERHASKVRFEVVPTFRFLHRDFLN